MLLIKYFAEIKIYTTTYIKKLKYNIYKSIYIYVINIVINKKKFHSKNRFSPTFFPFFFRGPLPLFFFLFTISFTRVYLMSYAAC